MFTYLLTYLESNATKAQWVCSRAESSTIWKQSSINQRICLIEIKTLWHKWYGQCSVLSAASRSYGPTSFRFDRHVVLLLLVECAMIWPSCNTVVTGGMHDDLTTMWYCCYWWNARWSDHHVVLLLLVECTMIWPSCNTVVTGGMHDDLTVL